MEKSYDLVVVGGGSGGLGAAISAARLGLRVLLVEHADELGGTAARGGVNCWEPGVGATGIAFDIYQRMKQIPNAVGVSSPSRHALWHLDDDQPRYPGGESQIDPAMTYMDTLRRFGGGSFRESEAFIKKYWHGVVLEPDAYRQVVGEMLSETSQCTVRLSTTFSRAIMDNGRITGLELDDGTLVSAAVFVDATGDGCLARACGCKTMLGPEGRDVFDEPDAPEVAGDHLNGITLLFRIGAKQVAQIDPLPENIPAECWWRESFPSVAVFEYPGGGFNLNMLPAMDGRDAFDLGPNAAYTECRRRVLAQWHHCQTVFPEFQGYEIAWVSPTLGIRESHRVVGWYVLTEHDLMAGLTGQTHEDIIAIADHAMDTHGGPRGGCGELKQPYGIPYRCLLPVGAENLMVACRAASFSSISASSCRLSRTMLALGQAAGTAASLAVRDGVDPPGIPVAELRDSLRRQHVQLNWPMSDELRQRIAGH